MELNYNINEVIRLRDEEKLKWKDIQEQIGVSSETLRKAYKRTKEGKTSHEANPNSYVKQKARGLDRKLSMIKLMGGKCCKCGYDKNIAALEFHHINPEEKEFQLDARHISNTKMEKLEKELSKCILVCSNCHKEIHHEDLTGLL